MTVFAYWDDYHVLREEVHILRPTPDSHVPLLSGGQGWIPLKTVWFKTLAGGLGEHALVEHGGEDVDVGGVLLVQIVCVQICEVEVDDDIVEEGVMLQGLVILEGNCDVGTLAHWELAQLVCVLQFVL